MAFFLRNGLHLLAPTTVDKTGASSVATIGANGSVTFSLCQTLSLNGVFSADYDNYMVVTRVSEGATSSLNVELRLRTGGTDASGSNYTWQWIEASGSSVTGLRTTSAAQTRVSIYTETGKRQGAVFYAYSPFLAQPTTFRGHSAGAFSDGYLIDYASSHSLSTSYDGFSLIVVSSSTFGGRIAVYGMRK